MKREDISPRGRRGFTLILYALMLTFIIASGGLALDVGTIYMIKARLSAAVDAAALAAGRSVNLADSVATATSQATTTAQQFFTANFPSGYFNTLNTPTVTPAFTQETDSNGNPSGVLDIAVTASVNAPTYFMNIFSVRSVTVTASGTASRRGVVMMLVLDQSSSMNTATTPTACTAMKEAAQNFITLFSPFDYIGLVKFDITAHLTYTPSQNWASGTLNTDLGNIVCGSNTNTISALEVAYQQIQAVGLPLAENTIVLFTDGSPNGVSAVFPVRAVADSRYGPAGTTANGFPNAPAPSCGDVGPSDPYLSSIGITENEEQICVNMPRMCTNAAQTVTGTLAQWGDQDSWGAGTYGLAAPTDSDPAPSWPSSCSNTGGLASTNIRQFIAYIPDTDKYGNSLHGVAASGTSPYGTVVGGKVTRDFWLFQTNNLCSPDSSISPNCKNTGDVWTSHPTIGTVSNFFPAGSAAYVGKFRPDQPNSVVAASMNGTMAAAYTIRSDTTYHPIIHVIYLTGNGTDSVDREFLPVVANYPTIPALPYDPSYVSGAITPLYANPAYQTSQETGKYFVTADKNQLTALFAQLASEVLRLSK